MVNKPVSDGTSSKKDMKSMPCQTFISLIIIKWICFTLSRTQWVKMMHIFLYKHALYTHFLSSLCFILFHATVLHTSTLPHAQWEYSTIFSDVKENQHFLCCSPIVSSHTHNSNNWGPKPSNDQSLPLPIISWPLRFILWPSGGDVTHNLATKQNMMQAKTRDKKHQ